MYSAAEGQRRLAHLLLAQDHRPEIPVDAHAVTDQRALLVERTLHFHPLLRIAALKRTDVLLFHVHSFSAMSP